MLLGDMLLNKHIGATRFQLLIDLWSVATARFTDLYKATYLKLG